VTDADAIPPRNDGWGRKVHDVAILVVAGSCTSALYFVLHTSWLLTGGGGFAGVSRDFIWMSPLGYLAVYVIFAFPIMVASPFLSRGRVLYAASLLLATLFVFDLLLPVTEIARPAAAVLGLGLGTVVARRVTAAPERALAVLRRAAISIVLVLGVSAVGLATAQWLGHRRGASQVGKAAADAPNVLFIIWDTVRASELSAYGYDKPTTPFLAQLAGQGAFFNAAIATAPWTLPSHASIFTGHYPQRLSTDLKVKFDGREATIAETFRKAGYSTVGVAANTFYTSWESGLNRGFTDYRDYRRNLQQVLRASLFGQSRFVTDLIEANSSTELKKAFSPPLLLTLPKPARVDMMRGHEVTDYFLGWERQRNQGRPFFAFLNYIDGHRPFDPPADLRQQFVVSKKRNPQELYDAEIAFLDRELQRLLGELEKRGQLKNTLVILTADHGEHFGERNLQGHGNSVYAPVVHVPLVMRFDNHITPGTTVTTPVSLRDLGATMLDLAGINATFPGVSLARYWTAASDSGSAAVALLGRVQMKDPSIPAAENGEVGIFADKWHLVRYGLRPIEELFAYRDDHAELTNVLGTDSAKGVADSLRTILKAAFMDDRPGRNKAKAAAATQ